MSQDYVLKSEKYVRKLEQERGELLEACKVLVSVFQDMQNGIEPDEGMWFLEFADGAIAKAEGKA